MVFLKLTLFYLKLTESSRRSFKPSRRFTYIESFENQQLRLNLETICFNETAHKVVHMFEEKLEKAQLKVIFDIEAPKVECDQRRIEQILIAFTG